MTTLSFGVFSRARLRHLAFSSAMPYCTCPLPRKRLSVDWVWSPSRQSAVLSEYGPRPSLLLWGTTFIAILCPPLEDLRERLLAASFLQLVEKSRSASTRVWFFLYSRRYNDLSKSVWPEDVHVSLSSPSLFFEALPGQKIYLLLFVSLLPPPPWKRFKFHLGHVFIYHCLLLIRGSFSWQGTTATACCIIKTVVPSVYFALLLVMRFNDRALN